MIQLSVGGKLWKMALHEIEMEKLHHLIVRALSGANLDIVDAWAIYNKDRRESWKEYTKTLEKRMEEAPELFKPKFKLNAKEQAILRHFEEICAKVPHNSPDRRIRVLPVAPGLRDFSVAQSIAESSLGHVGTTDQGWFGKGIYTTTKLRYALTYSGDENLVLILWACVGAVYPKIHVSEDGESLKSGATAHYAIVNHDTGHPVKRIEDFGRDNTADEIVIEQKSQYLPAYLIRLRE